MKILSYFQRIALAASRLIPWSKAMLWRQSVIQKMLSSTKRVLYLDREFIALSYEAITGRPAPTQIIKSDGLEVGIDASPFSAGMKIGESKSFSMSSLAMLQRIEDDLLDLPRLSHVHSEGMMHSEFGWINGIFSIQQVEWKRAKNGEELVETKTNFFFKSDDGNGYVLVLDSSALATGLSTFPGLLGHVITEFRVKASALMRVYPAGTDFKQMIAAPLVILEVP